MTYLLRCQRESAPVPAAAPRLSGEERSLESLLYYLRRQPPPPGRLALGAALLDGAESVGSYPLSRRRYPRRRTWRCEVHARRVDVGDTRGRVHHLEQQGKWLHPLTAHNAAAAGETRRAMSSARSALVESVRARYCAHASVCGPTVPVGAAAVVWRRAAWRAARTAAQGGRAGCCGG